jgi:hypothetical protein
MRFAWDSNSGLGSQKHAFYRNSVYHKSTQILACVCDDDYDNNNNNNNKMLMNTQVVISLFTDKINVVLNFP